MNTHNLIQHMKRALKNSCASGCRTFLKCFIGPSKVLVLFLFCFQSFTEINCLHLVRYAAVPLL